MSKATIYRWWLRYSPLSRERINDGRNAMSEVVASEFVTSDGVIEDPGVAKAETSPSPPPTV